MRTLEVVLRPDLVFSDGTPLDAAAFAESLMLNVDSGASGLGQLLFEVDSVDPVDDASAESGSIETSFATEPPSPSSTSARRMHR
jgi:ABC-type transport system substrate-binding protein